MTKVIKSLEDVDPWSLLSKEQLHAISRELFKRLDMVRAFDQDYEVAVAFFREIFDRGRSRGAYEGTD